jgi:hypothetical protein
VFGDRNDRERDGTTMYSLQEECKLGAPLERDCGGVLPSAFKTTLKGYMTLHPYISRAVRARALGVEVAEPEAPGEKDGGGIALAINETMVYNIVDSGNEFKAPCRQEIETGLEQLWTLEKGEWSEKNGGVELVWLNMPLPKVVSEEEATTYVFSSDPVRESEEVEAAIETEVKLLTGAGVMVVVGPMVVPPLELVAAGEVFPSLEAGVQVSGDCGSEGEEDKGKRVMVFSFLVLHRSLMYRQLVYEDDRNVLD